jgi:hypothetical protein
MYFPAMLWILVVFASFGGCSEALRSVTAKGFSQKILAASCVLQ